MSQKDRTGRLGRYIETRLHKDRRYAWGDAEYAITAAPVAGVESKIEEPAKPTFAHASKMTDARLEAAHENEPRLAVPSCVTVGDESATPRTTGTK